MVKPMYRKGDKVQILNFRNTVEEKIANAKGIITKVIDMSNTDDLWSLYDIKLDDSRKIKVPEDWIERL